MPTLHHSKFVLFYLAVLLLLGNLLQSACAADPGSDPLRDEYNALAASGVRKPYGFGWPQYAGDNGIRQIGARPGQSPAAALLLLRAGIKYNQRPWIEDAVQCAYLLQGGQDQTGKIADRISLGDFPGGANAAGSRDRASSCAAIGLIAEILRTTSHRQDRRLIDTAVIAGTWLMKQQLRAGGWPTEMIGDDPSHHPVRVFRLDGADWRDCTFALMILGDVLDRAPASHAARSACGALLKLQLGPSALYGQGAFASIYSIEGIPINDYLAEPYAIDATDTMYAAQTILADYLLTGDETDKTVLAHIAGAIAPLRRPKGRWYRLYGLPTSNPLPPTRPSDLYQFARDTVEDESSLAPQAMQPVMDLLAKLPTTAAEKIADHDHVLSEISSALCGLNDAPFTAQTILPAPRPDDDIAPADELNARIQRIVPTTAKP